MAADASFYFYRRKEVAYIGLVLTSLTNIEFFHVLVS